jgi:dolichol kinase
MTPPLAFWAFTAVFATLFLGAEAVKRRTRIPATATRKFLHVSSAVVSMWLPTYLSPGWMLVLAGFFTAVLTGSKLLKVLSSIHDVPRKTWGEVVFPLGIGVSAWLLYFSPWAPESPQLATNAYRFGLLTMGILDFVAELGGQIPSPKLWFGKTLAGSISFFGVGIILCLAHGMPISWALVAAVAGLTASESLLGHGLDNLALPSLGALAYLLLAASH